jgi:tetratricopeptide (TPR) repeat protein
VYRQQNKQAEAIGALHKAIEIMPEQPGPHVTLAGIPQQGRNAKAVAERKNAADLSRIAVNRQRATCAANTGRALLLKGQITDTIERYQEAVSSDPTYVEAHRGLAAAHSAVVIIVRRSIARYSITVILRRFHFDARKSGRLRANPKRGVGFEEAQEMFSHPYYLD